jgi:lysophospholipase L1-like esterase
MQEPVAAPNRGNVRRFRWRRAVLLLLAVWAAGEIVLRLADRLRGTTTGSLYDFVIPVSTRFKMRPDTVVTVPERYGDIVYRVNHDGYRDGDHDPAWRGPRLLWLGDSVTFGLGVAQERTYAARIARQLAAASPPWDTMNMAIFAYDTRHELLTLEEDGLKYHPRVVVLEFFMNDFSISSAIPRPSDVSWPDRLAALKNRLLYKSALFLRAQQLVLGGSYLLFHDARRNHFPQSLNTGEPAGEVAKLTAHPDDASLPTLAALAAIAATSRAHQARLLVFISPDEVQLFTERFDLINRRVGAFCRRMGIATFDPLPLLRARADRTRLFNDGVHYSDHGHQVMARLLLDALRSGGFLAGPAG